MSPPPAANGKPIPVQVPPGPVPVQMIVQQGQVNAEVVVILTMLTPVGQAVYFLPVEAARNLAAMLTDNATPILRG